GDTLVVDTARIKPTRWPVLDRYGTPHSDELHVVERFKLIDGKASVDAMAAHHGEYTKAPLGKFDAYGGVFDPDLSHKGLQVAVTVEDPKMFTQPWTGLVSGGVVPDVLPGDAGGRVQSAIAELRRADDHRGLGRARGSDDRTGSRHQHSRLDDWRCDLLDAGR